MTVRPPAKLTFSQKIAFVLLVALVVAVLVKLTPNTEDITKVAIAVAGAGADAISLINTIKGMAIDTTRRRPLLGNISGGLSGPAVKPVALKSVASILMAGASAIQVGTANLSNPQAPLEVLEGIERFMAKEGVADITELIGAARPKS